MKKNKVLDDTFQLIYLISHDGVYAQFDEAAMYFELKEMESITHIDSDLATAVANDTMIRQFPLCYQHKNMKSRN